MHTPLIEGLAAKYAKGDTEGFIQHRHKQVPMQHMGSGWDVANAVVFLAADESRYVTATEIVVDGGLVAATR
jgi:NAD(P)-dependent dehydrogenase (short-subunit alcohol dehydrogenase family)